VYKAVNQQGESKLRRALRLMDDYVNLSGHHTHALEDCTSQKPFNIASSRFLRPYNWKLAFLDGLRLRRIKKAMTHAAKTGRVFHLWWHPHNFGAGTQHNLAFMERILGHYIKLKNQHAVQSMNMGDITKLKTPLFKNNGSKPAERAV